MAQQPPGGYPPQQPPGGYPPQPPPGGYQGQPPGAYGQPAYPQAYRPQRPGSVTAAGVLLIVLGSLAGLGGILFGLGGAFLASADFGAEFGPLGDVSGAAGGILLAIAAVVIVYAVFKIIAGAKVLALRNGWRITGIVLCAIAIIGWILSMIGAFQGTEQILDPSTFEVSTVSAGPNVANIAFAAVFLIANVLTLVLLARAGSSFRRT
jgi:hypothetical protein